MKRAILTMAALALLVSGVGQAKAALIDVNQAFINFELANSGPTPAINGNFQYGTNATATAAGFVPYSPTEHTDNLGGYNSNIQGYNQANVTLTPFTTVNVDKVNSQSVVAGIVFGPGQIGLHPDSVGPREYSFIQWTAPSDGTFTATAKYNPIHTNPNTAVYLIDPTGTQTAVSGSNPTFVSSGFILAGETIDFAVGLGSTNLDSNSTGLYATIEFSAVPEPATMTMLGIGLAGLAGYGVRRRKQAASAA